MTNIVERLRHTAAYRQVGRDWIAVPPPELLIEAADEIERLTLLLKAESNSPNNDANF